MAYEVEFEGGRIINVYEPVGGYSPQEASSEAILQYGGKAYVWQESLGKAEWIDRPVPKVKYVRRMREVYQGGGYCLVPAEA